jgi:hypothetical protein
MGADRFDDLTKALAAGASRRGMLRAVVAAVGGTVLANLARGSALAQPPSCPAGRTRCEGVQGCVNLQNDPRNCGQCGNRCPPGARCAQGTCLEACLPPVCGSAAPQCGSIETCHAFRRTDTGACACVDTAQLSCEEMLDCTTSACPSGLVCVRTFCAACGAEQAAEKCVAPCGQAAGGASVTTSTSGTSPATGR